MYDGTLNKVVETLVIAFWTRTKSLLTDELTYKWLADDAGFPYNTLMSWISKDRIPPAEKVVAIAKSLGVSAEFLITGHDPYTEDEAKVALQEITTPPYHLQNGKKLHYSKDVVQIPVLPQQVSAGTGIDWMEEVEPTGSLPVISQMLRGHSTTKAGIMRAKGDSMTGVNIFNGDHVVFINGLVEDNGIYVLAIHGELFVKRLEFNPVEQKIRIISENKNYPPTELKADSEIVQICGKVVGWIHSHPY